MVCGAAIVTRHLALDCCVRASCLIVKSLCARIIVTHKNYISYRLKIKYKSVFSEALGGSDEGGLKHMYDAVGRCDVCVSNENIVHRHSI